MNPMKSPPTVRCTRCSAPYPAEGAPFVCPACGGIFDFDGPPVYDPGQRGAETGIFQYRSALCLPPGAPEISLGEGDTPLIPIRFRGSTVWLKLESLNPTGSYKDRGSAVLLSQLAARGITQAVEDSSGNAGASFAAYAARAGMQARVFVPAAASGPKRGQIEAYGAELVAVPGPRSAAAEAVLQDAARSGAAYASHAYLPFGLPGIATMAYEIAEQMKRLGETPQTVVAPVGHGGLLLGLMRGFSALTASEPFYAGVQARACAPVWHAFLHGMDALMSLEEAPTAAEGVRVRRPVRAEAILNHLSSAPQRGTILAVDEADILPAYHDLARQGIHVEPTSGLVWAALDQIYGKVPEPIVLILSGAGLKYPLSK